MQDTNVQNLIINNLTKAQYEGIASPSNTELYLIPDDSTDFLPKSGGTMTGDLTIEKTLPHVFCNASDVEWNVATATNRQIGSYEIRDKNDNWISIFGCEKFTDGRNVAKIQVKNPIDASTSARISVVADSNGNLYTDAPTPPSGDNTTKIATTAFVNTDFVKKTGSTMTGILHIGVNKQYADDIIIDSKTIDINSTTSVSSNDGIHFYDKNGNIGCYLIWQQSANSKDNYMSIGYNSTINPNFLGFNLPKATTKATTTSSASIYKPAVVVQNYVNGATWYRVWSDGWIEQGGFWNGTGAKNLLKNYSNTNYSITFGLTSPGNLTDNIYISNKATNQFTIAQGNGNGGAGIWYACGY